jgi:hypothetical protein
MAKPAPSWSYPPGKRQLATMSMAVGPLGSTRFSMRRCGRNSRVPYEFAHGTDQPGYLLHQMSVRVFVIVGFKGSMRMLNTSGTCTARRSGSSPPWWDEDQGPEEGRSVDGPALLGARDRYPAGRPRRNQIRHKYAATPAEASKAIKPSRRVALIPRIIATRTARQC